MDIEVIQRRNACFNVLYRRIIYLYPICVPPLIRWMMELMFFIMAIATLCIWGYVHLTYVVEPEDCLTDIKERPFSYEVILQVEVYSNTSELWAEVQSSLEELSSSMESISNPDNRTCLDKNCSGQDQSVKIDGDVINEDMEERVTPQSLFEILGGQRVNLYSVDYTILEFSQESGYLSLTHSARERLNISTRYLYINPENTTCFGANFGRFISKYFLGYEMMVIASFKNLLPAVQASGYVRNLMTGSHYYYRVQWMGKWRYITGVLPAFFFTLVASVLLRQIHYHGFKFLTHFHHLVNEGVPMPIQTGAQVPFLIITYAAIGLVIVMCEALGDSSSFSLLMVATVWEADQFYAIFCRHKISRIYFPMFFFLYHIIPYAYFLRFNGQFWFLPFLFHWFLLQGSLLFFLHHFEIRQWIHNQPVINQAQVQHQQRDQTDQYQARQVPVRGAQDREPLQAGHSSELVSPIEESRPTLEERGAAFINSQSSNVFPIAEDDHGAATTEPHDWTIAQLERPVLRERTVAHHDRENNG